jgi:hypothetical protein
MINSYYSALKDPSEHLLLIDCCNNGLILSKRENNIDYLDSAVSLESAWLSSYPDKYFDELKFQTLPRLLTEYIDTNEVEVMLDTCMKKGEFKQEFGGITCKRLFKFYFLTSLESEIGKDRKEYNEVIKVYEDRLLKCNTSDNEYPLTNFFYRYETENKELQRQNNMWDEVLFSIVIQKAGLI